ncbi:MAG: phospholipase D family protein [Alphaproteobacteria bacterium]
MVPFLEVLSDLIGRGVSVRLIHAREPGPAFRKDFDKYPALIEGLERLLCPRAHLKLVVVDGALAYAGSANLTGAGMGAKSAHRRNFETGIVTTDPAIVHRICEQFDAIWMGKHCDSCQRKPYCAEAHGMLTGEQ